MKNQKNQAGERTQYTPGPWANDGVTVFADLGDGINACDIAVMINDGVLPHAVKEANARLIAAAPELMEIVRILDRWQQGSDHIHFGALVGKEDGDTLGKLVKDVIANAEGRQS